MTCYACMVALSSASVLVVESHASQTCLFQNFPSVSVTCLLKEGSTHAWSESVSDLEAYGS